jgi:Xaa-Pro aminopeptidase
MLSAIKTQLPQAQWIDADLIVNWLRLVKSPAEFVYMTQAAQIAGHSMDAALAAVRPGARQCDVMAEAVAAQIRGTPEFSGDMTALHPLKLAGASASAAHPMWTDAPLDIDNAVAFELGGCRKRYNAGLARTAYLG